VSAAFAVQLAEAAGARVIALCSPSKADRIRKLSADFILDYSDSDLVRKVRDLIGRVARGELDPMIEHRITLAQILEYLWRLRHGQQVGKIVAAVV
jgi:NADPH:quinone reductase-like Zn-dependent oxidoreductase